jgi:hypothetical protein
MDMLCKGKGWKSLERSCLVTSCDLRNRIKTDLSQDVPALEALTADTAVFLLLLNRRSYLPSKGQEFDLCESDQKGFSGFIHMT